MADARHEFLAASVAGLVHLRSVPVVNTDDEPDRPFKSLKRRNSKAGYYRALSGVSFQSSVVDVIETVDCAPVTVEPHHQSEAAPLNPVRVTFIQRAQQKEHQDDHIYDTVEEMTSNSHSDLSDHDGESDNLSGLDLSIFEPGGSETSPTGFIYRPPRPVRRGSSSSFRERLKKNLLPKGLFNAGPQPPVPDYDESLSSKFLHFPSFVRSWKT